MDHSSMTLMVSCMVYSPSKEERIENADLRNRLIEQGLATRKDQSYANWGISLASTAL